MLIDNELLEILACPECKGDLTCEPSPKEGLLCRSCRLLYPIKEGIPVMLREEVIGEPER